MNDRDRFHLRVQRFNCQLDALLSGKDPAQSTLPDADQVALQVACKLAALDLSANSHSRRTFRHRLAAGMVRSSGWNVSFNRLAMPAFWAPLVLLTALLFGWLYGSLNYRSNPGVQGAAAAYTQTTGTGAAFSPQPIPTPLASHEPVTQAPAIPVSIQTPRLSSYRSISTGAPYALP